ncbi:hypothetical protein [Paenibacillus sp. YYML68]|uniref:hypothetical protein n=1 Tax=Paenibacillus sp. YYML68 TaxID=2909250 RepID=UPI0024934286|nr:hypothetical protein [Paenibacillus sp. YYML68]
MLKKLLVLIFSFALYVSFASSSFAATMGQLLESPEPGWQRYSYTSDLITYEGTGWHYVSSNKVYTQQNGTSGAKIKINFVGSKFRLLATTWTSFSKSITVKIDGVVVDTISQYGPSVSGPRLSYEKTGLAYGEHTIEFINNTTQYLTINSFDTDAPQAPIEPTLIAQSDISKNNLSWTSSSSATSYHIKRSTTAGGPYMSIATNVTGTTYSDTAVTHGTTYYYVVTAVNSYGESVHSNEASAKPTAPILNRALLVITLDSGLEKEYDVPMSVVNDFIHWYSNRENGVGYEYYVFNKNYNLAKFLSRKDYIAYSKIEAFEVNEYSENP